MSDRIARIPPPGDLAAALGARLRGGFVQDVRVGGSELLVLSIRQPGRTEILGLSTLAMAPGIVLRADPPAQHPADGLLTSMRDLLRACLGGARVERVMAGSREGRPLLRIDARRSDAASSVVLDFSGRGNLEIHRQGHAPQALRPPPGDLDDPGGIDAESAGEPGGVAVARAGADALLEAESARVEALRDRILHARRLAELRQRLRRARKAARTLVSRREADVAHLGDASRIRAEADALAAHMHLVARGQSRLDVDDWQGSPLRIALDPGQSASSNLRRAYARAAKAGRGAAESGRRLLEAREAEATLARLEAAASRPELDRVDAPDAAGALDAIEDEARGLLRPGRAQAPADRRRAGAEAATQGPREYVSLDGHRILVGRSSRGNDELTFRIARGNDVWLHARGCPGAHVVLMLPKGAEIPGESLLDAATLAHLGSKLGKEPRGEIAWCRAKDVSKRRGMKPGEVMVTRERVISLRVEPERVARLGA